MITQEFIDKWLLSNNVKFEDINNGDCENFAIDVCLTCIPQGVVVGTDNFCDWWGSGPDSKLPGHCWVMFEGKHYDCDSPEGVDEWRKLKIFEK